MATGHWVQIPAFPETVQVRLRGGGGQLEIWQEDDPGEPNSDPTVELLAAIQADLILVPNWFQRRHGGELVRLADVLRIIQRYQEDST